MRWSLHVGNTLLASAFLLAAAPASAVTTEILSLTDDGSAEVTLPFAVAICGQQFGSVFVNANGNLTFGEGSSSFFESASAFLSGPPRVAGLWDDLNPSSVGTVSWTHDGDDFTVQWQNVPEFVNTGSNTFSITLTDASNFFVGTDTLVSLDYGTVSAADGLAGISCGSVLTLGDEPATDLSASTSPIPVPNAAVFELFTVSSPFDLALASLSFASLPTYPDVFEPNNNAFASTWISPPFNTSNRDDLTAISPAGADVDYFAFVAQEGQSIIVEVSDSTIDSVVGIFELDASGATLLASDDNGGDGNLSRLVYTVPRIGVYAVAVTTVGDTAFDGSGSTDPVLGQGRYTLDVDLIYGVPLELGDDTTVEVPLGFSFPFQGNTYTSVFVNSNGNVTFGAGSTDLSESVADLLAGPPRIALLWDDLNPNNGGRVVTSSDVGEWTVAFYDVPEFSNTGANTFVLTLFANGDYQVEYGDISASDALVGTSAGGGAVDPGAVDLSSQSTWPRIGTTYELFQSTTPVDLAQDELAFD